MSDPTAETKTAAIEAIAHQVCVKGGHIPNRDKTLPGSCDFHQQMAGEYIDALIAAGLVVVTPEIAAEDEWNWRHDETGQIPLAPGFDSREEAEAFGAPGTDAFTLVRIVKFVISPRVTGTGKDN